MIITDTGPAPRRTLPPGGADLLAAALPSVGRACQLSDLLGGVDSAGSVYLADAATARSLLDRGVDPQLYRAYRDVVAPRPKPGQLSGVSAGAGAWFADLVVYSAATLADGPELGRSLGHWNTPAQIEIFQCLTGRVLMLHTNIDDLGRATVDLHLCQTGDHVVIPFGAWHLTAVLDAPAVVFNIYTDATPLLAGHTSRDAATRAELKYHTAPAPEIAVVRTESGIALTGASPELTEQAVRPGDVPSWARKVLEPSGLAALYQHAPDAELTRLQEHALRHGNPPSRAGAARPAPCVR
jgi:hypothetical protein